MSWIEVISGPHGVQLRQRQVDPIGGGTNVTDLGDAMSAEQAIGLSKALTLAAGSVAIHEEVRRRELRGEIASCRQELEKLERELESANAP